jgi:hypothetical protein
MTRTKGALNKHHVERLIPATFKIKREVWIAFKNRFGIRCPSMLREYVEGIVKDAG